jgi:hypothetical protein
LLLITKQAEFFDLNHMIKIKKSDDLNHDLNLDLNQVDLNLRTLVLIVLLFLSVPLRFFVDFFKFVK